MWLKLDLDGIDFHFRVSGYQPSTKENWDENWCNVDLVVQDGKSIDYRLGTGELLLASEVETVYQKLEALLIDEIQEDEEYECIEPDLFFSFYAKHDRRNDPRIAYVRPGYEIEDIAMDLIITFWNREGALSGNRLTLMFYRDDIEKLAAYLGFVIGSLEKDNGRVHSLINKGFIYG